MLPYTPLHVLLFGLPGDPAGPDALVMTSGNLSGEPIVTDDDEALTRLGRLADAWLRHDRPIQVPCDDSVAGFVGGAELPIRRSRGYAPLPVALPFEVDADARHRRRPEEHLRRRERPLRLGQPAHRRHGRPGHASGARPPPSAHLEELTGVRPRRWSSPTRTRATAPPRWAREHAAGRPVRTVQHHHAHVASVMAEHGLGARRAA